ncbi:hypothetical protein FRD01_22805 [Microvenator marinus]|uniref:Uncharacterized protein n=1 Tax=Microvenator marinus TaxID=2600177 RepID=A0A5B8XXV2_9DELT|nr:hypothetical protein [Microvenator marinus]QED30011.1 hypothetical protein FRD01_22805 [Microvenator marinus]
MAQDDPIHFLEAGLERPDGTLLMPGYDTSEDMLANPHTLLLSGKPGEIEEIANLSWQTVATSSPAPERLVFVSEWGNYFDFASFEDHASGVLDDDGEIEYRSVDNVGGELYACGGSRTIRRLTDEGWVDESEDLEPGNLIEAVSGFSGDELYGFGWNGEIWWREGGSWRAVESPTERILQAACIVDGRVFVGGQLGVILEGRHDAWGVIENDHKLDIWSVCEFEGVPYFSTIDGILRLHDGKIEKMDTRELKSTHKLFVGPSGLWSVGGGTLGLYDGTEWRCVQQLGD